MKKLMSQTLTFFIIVVLLCAFTLAQKDSVTKQGKKDLVTAYNTLSVEHPGPWTKLLANEKINVYVDQKITISVATKDGLITEVAQTAFTKPTINLYFDSKSYNELLAGKLDLTKALKSKAVTYEVVGFFRKIKVGIGGILPKIKGLIGKTDTPKNETASQPEGNPSLIDTEPVHEESASSEVPEKEYLPGTRSSENPFDREDPYSSSYVEQVEDPVEPSITFSIEEKTYYKYQWPQYTRITASAPRKIHRIEYTLQRQEDDAYWDNDLNGFGRGGWTLTPTLNEHRLVNLQTSLTESLTIERKNYRHGGYTLTARAFDDTGYESVLEVLYFEISDELGNRDCAPDCPTITFRPTDESYDWYSLPEYFWVKYNAKAPAKIEGYELSLMRMSDKKYFDSSIQTNISYTHVVGRASSQLMRQGGWTSTPVVSWSHIRSTASQVEQPAQYWEGFFTPGEYRLRARVLDSEGRDSDDIDYYFTFIDSPRKHVILTSPQPGETFHPDDMVPVRGICRGKGGVVSVSYKAVGEGFDWHTPISQDSFTPDENRFYVNGSCSYDLRLEQADYYEGGTGRHILDPPYGPVMISIRSGADDGENVIVQLVPR